MDNYVRLRTGPTSPSNHIAWPNVLLSHWRVCSDFWKPFSDLIHQIPSDFQLFPLKKRTSSGTKFKTNLDTAIVSFLNEQDPVLFFFRPGLVFYTCTIIGKVCCVEK